MIPNAMAPLMPHMRAELCNAQKEKLVPQWKCLQKRDHFLGRGGCANASFTAPPAFVKIDKMGTPPEEAVSDFFSETLRLWLREGSLWTDGVANKLATVHSLNAPFKFRMALAADQLFSM